MRKTKLALLCAMLLLAHGLNAQNTLTTIAGGGSKVGDGVAATSASFYYPGGLAMDAAGNVYVADQYQHRIRKVDKNTNLITTVAGDGSQSFSGDGGLAVNAAFNYPADVAVDAAGNLYIADQSNHRIRKVTASTGIISTIGGNGTAGFSNTGVGQFYNPTGVAVDASGNVYVADNGNHRIRKITPTGVVSTVAGTTTSGLSGDGGAATSAKLAFPRDVTVDAAGNLYIADYQNSRLRKVTVSTGIITTVAGTTSGFSGDGGLATAAQLSGTYAVDLDASGNLYITDYNNYRVRKVTASSGIITTVAGSGTQGISGNGSAATAATMYNPAGIVLDASGNMYISDEAGQQVRKVTVSTNTISLYAGYNPDGVAYHRDYVGFGELATKANIDATKKMARAANGDVYFTTYSPQGQRVIAKVDAATNILSYVYGSVDGSGTYPNDGGLATQTTLYCEDGIAMDASGNIYFSELTYHRVRKITVSTGIITTIIGDGTAGNINTGAGRVTNPRGVALDASGNVYVADNGNHRIRKVTPAGVKSTIAGTTSGFSGDGAAATSAKLSYPYDVAVDGAGNVYIADYYNYRIRKITAATGIISTVGGNGSNGNTGDGGQATAAAMPELMSVAVDASGNIYVNAAWNSYGVRKIDAATGIIDAVINDNWDDGQPMTKEDGADALKTGLDNAGSVYVDGSGLYATSSFRIRKMIAAGNTIAVGTDPNYTSCTDIMANAVPYSVTGTFNAGNVFTLQLSDATGSFANPTAIGSLNSTASGTIQATFPDNIVSSSLYRLRVVSSSPAVTGAASAVAYSLPRVPITTNQLTAVDLCTGSSIAFSVTGSVSPRTYQWYKNSVVISGATSATYTTTTAGTYYVYTTDAITGCNANSASTVVTARSLPAVPTITPASAQSICAGGSVTLTRNNVASTTYQWTQGAGTGGPTTPGGTPISGATGLTYVAMPAASDSFRVVATNIYGCKRTSASVMINVTPAPDVTVTASGPTTFNAGGSVTLSVPTASGVAYQWKKDGVNISGATSASYTATMAGSYTVVATNSTMGCTATSAATVVTVNSITASITPASAQTICQGNTVVLTANSGTGYTYQWQLNNNNISGATAQSLVVSAAGDYTVVVSDGAASATSGTVTVTVLPLPDVTVTAGGSTALCTGGSVTLTVTSTSGAAYQWMNNGTAISGATSASYTATAAGSYTVMVTSNVGCNATSTATNVTVSNCAPVITSLSPASAVCQSGAIAVTFSSTGTFNAGNVFTAQLSNASGSFASPVSIGTLSGTSPGVINATIGAAQAIGTGYRIRVISSSPAMTGADNGSNMTVVAPPTTAQATISPSGTSTVCAGASVTLSVPNTAGLSYQWRVGGVAISGATSNIYVASPTANSLYSVVVTNATGCSRTSANKTVNVSAAPAATIAPATSQNLCGAVTSVTFSANTGTGLTYVWKKDGTAISGATSSTYTATTVGVYTVTVTNSTGCSATSAGVTVTANCSVAITNTGTQTVCAGSSVTANFSTSGFSTGNVFTLQLSDASGSFVSPVAIGTLTATSGTAITGTIPAGTTAGDGYKLRIVTSNPATTGDPSPLTLQVRNALVNNQELCAVSVDSATGKNKLIWNKPVTANIDSFVFYRQNDMATYVRVGAQAYSVFSTWIDPTSTPANKAQRYYITAKNACGETAMGMAHRTMHLTINKGTNDNTWNLIWNGYEGATHSYYNIYRGTSPAAMTLLGNLTAGSYNSYTDNTAPTGTIYYMVTVADAPACAPNRPTEGTGNGEEIMSNIATSGVGGFAANWMDMTVYPNPSTTAGTLLIESSHADDAVMVRVLDVTGRVAYRSQTAPGKALSFGEAFAPGVYTIEATNGSGLRAVKKWVKQ